MIVGEDTRVWIEGLKEPIIGRLLVARGFFRRALGLLTRSALPDHEGLLIPNCSSIHTFGMRFPIDVLFFSGDGVVEALYPDTPSGYLLVPRLRGVHTLEVNAGFIKKYGIKKGDKLIIGSGD